MKLLTKIKKATIILFTNWKCWIFLFLFMGLFGTFFNHQKQFPNNAILNQLYGNTLTNILGISLLLFGWTFWEFAIGKRKSNIFGIISVISFIASLSLIGNLFSFIGIGIAISIIIPVMITKLKPLNFKKGAKNFKLVFKNKK